MVALILGYWSVVRADALLTRDDNPRLLETERRILRGQILDRNNVVLAKSTGPADRLTRVYPVPESSPVVGYYSLRFGAAGIENAFDDHLRGQSVNYLSDAFRRLLHIPSVGADIRLTIDASLQQTANALMDERGITGALVLLELTQIGGEQVAEVRAMVSHPGYDPNLIDAEFDALTAIDPGPLVNRAAQGLYQPGMVLQPMIAAAAIDSGQLTLDDPLSDPFLPVSLHGQVLRCAIPRTEANTTVYTWRDMATLRCPDPLRALGVTLGGPALDEIFSRFGLHQAPALPIPVEGNPATITDPGLAAIGQEALTITPLQAALAAAAVAGDGRLPRPRLVEGLAGPNGAWQTQPAGESANPQVVISYQAAEAIRQTWPVNNGIASFAVNVLAGPEDSRNAWYLGMTPAESPRYVLALVLEGESDTNAVERIGQELLATARDDR